MAGHRVEPPAGQPPDPLGDIYVPKDLLIRAPSRAATLLPEVREIIRQVDPEQPVSDVRLLREVVSQSKRPTGAPSSGYWVHWQ